MGPSSPNNPEQSSSIGDWVIPGLVMQAAPFHHSSPPDFELSRPALCCFFEGFFAHPCCGLPSPISPTASSTPLLKSRLSQNRERPFWSDHATTIPHSGELTFLGLSDPFDLNEIKVRAGGSFGSIPLSLLRLTDGKNQ